MTTPPNTIYLQFHGDSDPCDETPVDPRDVTWCKDKIFGSDELYIRGEHILPLLERVSCNMATPFEVWGWLKQLHKP